MAALLAGGVWFSVSLFTQLPPLAAIERIGDMDQATTVYDRADRIAFTIFKEQRIEVPLDAMSPHLVHAIVAIEDQRFYGHHGFDPIRIVAAALQNVRRGRAAQGGSTITQQLARQSFLSADKTYRRKIQELILASRLERMYSKARILELYLNKVYFGDGLYGAEAAARGYFGKHASQLSLEESALLAGLVQSPARYSPTVNPERARIRRNVVLQAMLGTDAIDRSTWESAHVSSVILTDGLHTSEPFGQYFKEQVRQELVERFGWERVYEGGLRVFSTIDTAMQQAAEASVATSLGVLDKRRAALAAGRPRVARKLDPTIRDDAGPLQAALIAMDPRTGQVRAMVGGRNFAESPFNRAVQAKRQPGSAFKPFVYAAAIEAGYTPATLIEHLNDPVSTLEGAWTPEDDHSTADTMSLRTGLRTSSNRAAVRLLQDVGIARTVSYAKAMGVGDVPSVPSLALGSGEVTLQSLTAAYSAFANHGLVSPPVLIRRVEDRDGTVLYSAPQSSIRAINDTTAYLMATLMADVVDAGTAARIRQLGFALPAAGKTGTTNDFHDAWFVGFTPSLIAGAWVGFDEPRTILPNGFAADVAVPLWTAFMKQATKGARPDWLNAPAGIVSARICRLTGKLATDGCDTVAVVDDLGRRSTQSMAYTEYFVSGTQPTNTCDLHRAHGVFRTFVALFHGTPAPVRLDAVGMAPAAMVADAGPPHEKRGFWSKLLGTGTRNNQGK